jgi:hypothetical protein
MTRFSTTARWLALWPLCLLATGAGLAAPVPASPALLPAPASIAIAVHPGHLLVGCSNQVRQVDLADPQRRLPTLTFSGPVRQIIPTADWTFVVCDGVGALAVTVGRASSLAPPLPFPGSAKARRLVRTNTRAMVAAGPDGLLTYSVTNPAAPVLLSAFRGAIDAHAVSLIASVAVVADGVFGLKFVDLSEPENPVLVGVGLDANLGCIRAVATSGTRVVASDGRRLCLFDASNPARAVRLAAYEAPAAVHDLVISGGRLFLACGHRGVVILDLAAELAELGRFQWAGDALGLAIAGNSGYVATGSGQWRSWKISAALGTAESTGRGPR